MLATFKEIYRSRELLWELVRRELKIRYKDSVLGVLWSLMTPLISVAVMTFVIRNIMTNSMPNLSAYVLAAYLPFTFFNTAILDSAQSVLSNLGIMKKVYVMHELFPIAQVISNAIHLIISFAILIVYMLCVYAFSGFQQSPFTWHILFLPVVFVVNMILITGLSLIISSLNVFYEDVKHIVALTLWMLFFLTPVMYFNEQIYSKSLEANNGLLMYNLYHLNPVAILCTEYRKCLVHADWITLSSGKVVHVLPFNWGQFTYLVCFSVGCLFVGMWFFQRMKWRFVERP